MNPVALEQRIVRFRRTLPGELLWVVALTLLLVRGPISAVFTLYSGVSGSDFEIFYESARVWLAGGSAYPAHTTGPNLTVPHLMPVFGLLAMLPLPWAITAWLLLNAAGAWLAWRLIRQTLGLQVPTNVGILALVLALASLPSLQQIRYGQVGWVLLPVVTAAWVMAREGRPVGSAALMGALITVKPFFGLWLAYYVVRGHWKAVLVATAVAGTIVLASIGLQGAEMWWHWKALALRDWYGQHDNASVMGVLARTLGHHPATWVWGLACLPVLAVASWSLMRQPRSVDRDWLVVSGAALLPAPIGRSARLRVGELVFAVGHPWGDPWIVTAGVVSALGPLPGSGPEVARSYIRSDVRLAPGNSGGPLLDARGEVVGVNAMVIGGDLAVAIPIDVVSRWLGASR